MTAADMTVTVTIPRWRMFLLRAFVHLCCLRVRMGMPFADVMRDVAAAAEWAVRGARVR